MYYRTIAGNKSLKQIESLILAEESGGSKFVENKVSAMNGKIVNLVKFIELGVGKLPPPALLQLQFQAPPAGKSVEWTGVMLVNGTQTIVVLYR